MEISVSLSGIMGDSFEMAFLHKSYRWDKCETAYHHSGVAKAALLFYLFIFFQRYEQTFIAWNFQRIFLLQRRKIMEVFEKLSWRVFRRKIVRQEVCNVANGDLSLNILDKCSVAQWVTGRKFLDRLVTHSRSRGERSFTTVFKSWFHLKIVD